MTFDHRLRCLIFYAIALITLDGNACTTFAVFRGQDSLVGKSFEWFNSSGWAVINKRNVQKRSLITRKDDIAIDWTSRYGSVTFNQHGREFPLGGVNEQGLVVEIMLAGNQDPPMDSRPAINELQWIQFQLDNFATTTDVVAHATDLRISRLFAMVHYLVCDKSKVCAVIEPFFSKTALVYVGKDLFTNVLANDSYEDSLNFLRKHIGFGGNLPFPSGDGSLERFVRASALVTQYSAAPPAELGASFAFEVLRNISWAAQWNIVYDLKSDRIRFRTSQEPAIKDIDTRAFDYSCRTPVTLFHMNQNIEAGEVTSRFASYTAPLNEKIVRLGMQGLETHLPEGTIERFVQYPQSTVCTE